MSSEKHNLLEDVSELEKEIKAISRRAKILGQLADLKTEKLCIGKLVSDIEEILGLKPDDADPFTLTGRLVAIKLKLEDNSQHREEIDQVVIVEITREMNEGFQNYAVNHLNEGERHTVFKQWKHLNSSVNKMAYVIREIGHAAYKDKENFPQSQSFTRTLARSAGALMARSLNVSVIYPSPALNISRLDRRALIGAARHIATTVESCNYLVEVVNRHYPCHSQQ